MKSLLKLTVGIFALSFAQHASATNYTIRVTGATAFRAATHKAIINFLGGNASTGVPVRMAHSGTASTDVGAQGANYATYIATVSTDTYTIQASFSGSVEGVRDIGQVNNIPFIPASEVPATLEGFANAFRVTQPDSVTPPSNATESATANFAFSDVVKSSTEFDGLTLNTPDPVGIIPFVWVANRGSTLTGITAQQARRLFTSGYVSKALFTGLVADHPVTSPFNAGAYVVLTGRNKLSGTRVATLAETQHGVFSAVQQYKVVTTTGTAGGTVGGGNDPQLTKLELWPNYGTTTDIEPVTGNGGYLSGSGISGVLGFQGASVNLVFNPDGEGEITLLSGKKVDLVGYLGVSDAATATNGTNQGVRLTWNGNSYTGSGQNDNVIYGKYTFWSVEQLYTKGTLNTGESAFKASLISFLSTGTNVGSSAINITTMKVTRGTDGGLVGF